MRRAWKFYFNYELSPWDLKACHTFRKRQNTGLSVPIITKFLYNRDKNEIYARRKMLRGYQNQGKNLFITETIARLKFSSRRCQRVCLQCKSWINTCCEVASWGSDETCSKKPQQEYYAKKENKRGIQDVDTMEAEVATPTVKKVSNTTSPVLEAGSSANACG